MHWTCGLWDVCSQVRSVQVAIHSSIHPICIYEMLYTSIFFLPLYACMYDVRYDIPEGAVFSWPRQLRPTRQNRQSMVYAGHHIISSIIVTLLMNDVTHACPLAYRYWVRTSCSST